MAFIAKGGRVWRGRVSRIEPVRVGALGGVWHSVYFYGWRGVEDRPHVEHFRIRETATVRRSDVSATWFVIDAVVWYM